jgi:thiosulfate/3-mercaptopyruvate sulfurtransferase
MSEIYRTLISADALAERLTQDAPIRLFDCRARLGEPDRGAALFAVGHIEGALHADLDIHLSDTPGSQGRHPLPAFDTWLAQARRWGLTGDEQIVVYDDAGGQMAARAWWMFRWLGHEATAVLDGGLGQWQQPLAPGPGHEPSPSNFQPKPPLTRLWQVDQVMDNLQTSTHTLVDARSEIRFRGEQEPIDPVAGHIPGAMCLPSTDNLTDSNCFKSAETLRTRFAHVASGNAVCYCGSGVTAAHNVLAMRIAGLPEAALYADSWSGWITDSTRPVAPNPTRDT